MKKVSKYFIFTTVIFSISLLLGLIQTRKFLGSKDNFRIGFGNYNFIRLDHDLWVKDADWSLFALKDGKITLLEKPASLHETDLYDPMIISWENNKSCEAVFILAETCSITSGPSYGCVIDRLDYRLPEGKLISRKTVLDVKPKTSYSLPITLFDKKYIVVEATLVSDGFPLFYPVNEFEDIGTVYTLNQIEPEIIIHEPLFDISVLNFPKGLILTGTDRSDKMRAFQLFNKNNNFTAQEIPFFSKTTGDNEVRRNAGLLANKITNLDTSLSSTGVIQPTMLNYENGKYNYGKKLGLATFNFDGKKLEAELIKEGFLENIIKEQNASGYHHIYQTAECSEWMIGDLRIDRYHRIHGDKFGIFE